MILQFTRDSKLNREIKHATNNEICQAISIRKPKENVKKSKIC